MKQEYSPQERVLLNATIENTNLKITVEQLKDELATSQLKLQAAQAELNTLLKKEVKKNED